MNKKAQGLSINVIILAALALLVLIILAVLLLRGGTTIQTGTGCEGAGGECSDVPCNEREGGIWTANIGNNGVSGGCQAEEVCCVQISEVPSGTD